MVQGYTNSEDKALMKGIHFQQKKRSKIIQHSLTLPRDLQTEGRTSAYRPLDLRTQNSYDKANCNI